MASSPSSAGDVDSSSSSSSALGRLHAISKPEGLPEWRRRVHYRFGKSAPALRSATDCASGTVTGQVKEPAECREEALEWWRRHPQVRFGRYSSDDDADTTDTVSVLTNPATSVEMSSLSHRGRPALDAVQDCADEGSASLAHMGEEYAAMRARGDLGSQSISKLEHAMATASTQAFLLSLRQQAARGNLSPSRLPATSDSVSGRSALGLDASTELHAGAQSVLSENAESMRQADAETSPSQALFDLSGRHVPVFDMAVHDETHDFGNEITENNMEPEEAAAHRLTVMQSEAQQVFKILQLRDLQKRKTTAVVSEPTTPYSDTTDGITRRYISQLSKLCEERHAPDDVETTRQELYSYINSMHTRFTGCASEAFEAGLTSGFTDEMHPADADVDLRCCTFDEAAHALLKTDSNHSVQRSAADEAIASRLSESRGVHGSSAALRTSNGVLNKETNDPVHNSVLDEGMASRPSEGRGVCGSSAATKAVHELLNENRNGPECIKVDSRMTEQGQALPSSPPWPKCNGLAEVCTRTTIRRSMQVKSDAWTQVCTRTTATRSTHTPSIDVSADTHSSINAMRAIYQPDYENMAKVSRAVAGLASGRRPSNDVSTTSGSEASADYHEGGSADKCQLQRQQVEPTGPRSTTAVLHLTGSVAMTAATGAVVALVIAACAVIFTIAAIFTLVIALMWLLVEGVKYACRCRAAPPEDVQPQTRGGIGHPFYCWDKLCYFMWRCLSLLSPWLPQWASLGRHAASD